MMTANKLETTNALLFVEYRATRPTEGDRQKWHESCGCRAYDKTSGRHLLRGAKKERWVRTGGSFRFSCWSWSSKSIWLSTPPFDQITTIINDNYCSESEVCVYPQHRIRRNSTRNLTTRHRPGRQGGWSKSHLVTAHLWYIQESLLLHLLFPLLSQKVRLQQIKASGLQATCSALAGVNVEQLGGHEQATVDKGCFVGVFEVNHDYFFFFIPILLKDLLLEFEVLFVAGLCGIEVSPSVEACWWLDVFLVDRFDVFFVHGFAGFGDGGLNSNHCSKINIKVYYA